MLAWQDITLIYTASKPFLDHWYGNDCRAAVHLVELSTETFLRITAINATCSFNINVSNRRPHLSKNRNGTPHLIGFLNKLRAQFFSNQHGKQKTPNGHGGRWP